MISQWAKMNPAAFTERQLNTRSDMRELEYKKLNVNSACQLLHANSEIAC